MTIIDGRPFTTFEVAKTCGVFHTTVINWVNKGKLKAHHTPGGHRRIKMHDLVEFMKQFDFPVPANLMQLTKKVLIVEDDPAVQRMLARALQSLPVTIKTCSGGLEALMAIGQDVPDLLILDVRIPQVNGVEVCKLLKASEQTKPVKIVAVSGQPLPEQTETYLRSEVDLFMQKPLPTAQLKSKVRELLDLEEATAPAVK